MKWNLSDYWVSWSDNYIWVVMALQKDADTCGKKYDLFWIRNTLKNINVLSRIEPKTMCKNLRMHNIISNTHNKLVSYWWVYPVTKSSVTIRHLRKLYFLYHMWIVTNALMYHGSDTLSSLAMYLIYNDLNILYKFW